MAAHDRSAVALLLAAVMLTGCGGAPQPVTPLATAETKPPAPASAPAAEPPANPAAVPARDDTPVVVDPGEEGEGKPVSLAEAAQAEKERRARAGEPVAIITDKTLPGYARKGQITVADAKPKGTTPAAPVQPAQGEPVVRNEQYWRARALDIRVRWRQAADQVRELEQQAAEQRERFYREDDLLIRDHRIKPDWDRVLDRLRQARSDVEAARNELADFLEEGRRAEALPGWLREGEAEEPEEEPRKKERQPAAQSIEPPVLSEPAGDPPGGRI